MVTSTNIRSIGYDPARKTLEVEFHTGAVHEYDGVPADLADSLVRADSVGRFFNQNVKDAFPSRRVAA
jgi:hypothetical protein